MRKQDPITGTWVRTRDGARPLVLVAEDDWDARQLYRELLDLRGFRVLACEDGAEALEKAVAHTPAAIILDLALPRIDGWSVAERLRAERATRAIPIFAITAHSDDESRARAKSAGCDRVFVKPLDHRALVRELLAVTRAPR